MGSLGAANNKDALKRQNVTHILIVAGSIPPFHPRDFTYKVIEGNPFPYKTVVIIFALECLIEAKISVYYRTYTLFNDLIRLREKK